MLSTRMTFAHLKQVVSIASVLADKGLIHHLTKKGDRLCGPCPVHGGDNPNAFVVSCRKICGIASPDARQAGMSSCLYGSWIKARTLKPCNTSLPWQTPKPAQKGLLITRPAAPSGLLPDV
jgi:hypothetical protein